MRHLLAAAAALLACVTAAHAVPETWPADPSPAAPAAEPEGADPAAAVTAPGPATAAADDAPAQRVTYGPFEWSGESPRSLFLVGEIEVGDAFSLRRAMRERDVGILVTASPGGNLYEALQIAEILRDKGVGTFIPEGAGCESACASAFFGGAFRVADGDLGVHQFFSAEGDSGEANAQSATADMIGTWASLDVPPFVFEKALSEREMYYFGPEEVARIEIAPEGEGLAMIDEARRFAAGDSAGEILVAAREKGAGPDEIAGVKAPEPDAFERPDPAPAPSGDRLADAERYVSTDFFGSDLFPKGVRGVSLGECERACAENDACAAYSYVSKTRWCWPKSEVSNVTVGPGVTSGVIDFDRVAASAFETGFSQISGHDLRGQDLVPEGLRGMSLDECRDVCMARTECEAFSWLVSKRICFPKYGPGEVVRQPGTISGRKN